MRNAGFGSTGFFWTGLWMPFAALRGLIAAFMPLGKKQHAAAQSIPT